MKENHLLAEGLIKKILIMTVHDLIIIMSYLQVLQVSMINLLMKDRQMNMLMI